MNLDSPLYLTRLPSSSCVQCSIVFKISRGATQGFSKVFFSPHPPPQKERKEGFVALARPRPSHKNFFFFLGGKKNEGRQMLDFLALPNQIRTTKPHR